MKTFKIVILIPFLFILNTSYGQGCSDAGFCSLDGIQNSDSHLTSFKNQFTLGSSYGMADHNITIVAPYLSYRRSLGQNLSLSAKITSIKQSHQEAENAGLSDLFVIANYQLSNKLNLTVGTKLPLGDGNDVYNSIYPYPLDFQASLGTTDLIIGFATNVKKLQINVATQLPVSQGENTFYSGIYDTSNFYSDFQSTYNYKRKGDVLVRGTYEISNTDKMRFTSSLLSIYHLGEDTYSNPLLFGYGEQKIEGSSGLTINLNLFLDYHISQKSSMNFSIGSPILVKKARPDGLTRSFIASLAYNYQF